ncbi:MAG: hypothetical protein NT069_32565 [Planctomycetota bacterium]|nr:hypothetical protein [Planctomycetota bacterium]
MKKALRRATWLVPLFTGLIVVVYLFAGQWERNRARAEVFRLGGSVATSPQFPEIILERLPESLGDTFWNLELVAFNDRSFDSKKLAGLRQLSGLRGLKKLYLNGTGVDDEAIGLLSAWSSLEELYLEDTSIGDAGLESIGKLVSLRVVSLRNTRVTAEGVARLQTRAPRLDVLGWMNMRSGAE